MRPESPSWLRYLPHAVRARVEHRPHLQKVLINTGWLFSDKILRMGVGLVVGVWIARYLGPEQFGLMNYAMAVVAVAGPISSLGLSNIVVRDLVRGPAPGVTLGTAFLLQLVGGVLAFCVAIAAVSVVRPHDYIVKMLVAVLGFAMVFKSTEVVKYWFEAQVNSKYVVWAENGIFVFMAAVKVLLIVTEAPLMAFVWAVFAEGVFVAIGLIGVYSWRTNTLASWKVSYIRAKELLRDGWPLILSGLAVMAYMRIDQIMIGQMLGNEAVGVYSAAVRISEVWYFAPMAIVASVFPSIIEAKARAEPVYYIRLLRLYDIMVVMSLCVAVPMLFLSDSVVLFLYGSEYNAAARVLMINIWGGLFVALGVAANKWVVLEGHTRNALLRVTLGAVVNVIANLILIPRYSIEGAAWATLISYAFANWISLGMVRSTRLCFSMQTRALFGLGFGLCRSR